MWECERKYIMLFLLVVIASFSLSSLPLPEITLYYKRNVQSVEHQSSQAVRSCISTYVVSFHVNTCLTQKL